jgi:hypothetical protein
MKMPEYFLRFEPKFSFLNKFKKKFLNINFHEKRSGGNPVDTFVETHGSEFNSLLQKRLELKPIFLNISVSVVSYT